MATVKIYLDKRKIRKDGTYPVKLLIHASTYSTTRKTGISIQEQHWDAESECISRTHDYHKKLNKQLRDMRVKYQAEFVGKTEQEIIARLCQGKTSRKTSEEGERHVPVRSNVAVKDFVQSLIDDQKSIGRYGNASIYELCLNRLLKYTSESVLFSDIDYEFISHYQGSLIQSEIKPNTVYLYLRTLRIFFNKAIRAKVIDKSLYPFDDFPLKGERTRKRSIMNEDILKVRDLCLPEGSLKWHARNIFLFSFYTIGMAIVDIAFLKVENIRKGRILYKRRKTGKHYDIKITPVAQAIIDYYLGKKPGEIEPDTYIFPFELEGLPDEESRIRKIKSKTRTVNEFLTKIGRECGIEEKLTTYVARHSWATIAKRMGYSYELIAEALGHEFGNKMTNIYLDAFDKELIDEANLKVTG